MALTVTFLFILFIGAVLGLRLRVHALILASILTVVVAASIGMADKQSAWSAALTTMVAVVVLQMGYLTAIAAHGVCDLPCCNDGSSAASFP